jgi:hypothetical protein
MTSWWVVEKIEQDPLGVPNRFGTPSGTSDRRVVFNDIPAKGVDVSGCNRELVP